MLRNFVWPNVKKKCPSDWKELLKIWGQNFLKSLEQFIQSVGTNLKQNTFLTCYWRFLQIEYIGINNWDVLRKLWEQIGKVKCCLIKVFALFWVGYKSTQCLFIFHFRLKRVFFPWKKNGAKYFSILNWLVFIKEALFKKTTQQYTFCVNVK